MSRYTAMADVANEIYREDSHLDENMRTNTLFRERAFCHGKINRGGRLQEPDVRVHRGGSLYAVRDRLARLVPPMDNAGTIMGGLQAQSQPSIRGSVEGHLQVSQLALKVMTVSSRHTPDK